jgi:hypothetical protein
MVLHGLCDLPLHHDDAHRHFLPLSHLRFESPVSYWDPAHYGLWMAPLEAVLMLGASAVVWRRFPSRAARLGTAGVAATYVLLLGVVAWLALR